MAALIFISGCITDQNGNKENNTSTIKSELIPTINLPAGFTFMTVHETENPIGNSSLKSIEGVYRTDTGDDIYIQVFKTDSPQALIDEYKSQYKDAGYQPFTEIYFNGHKATQVMYFYTKNGKSEPKYNLIWEAKDSVIKVGPSTDTQKVINLATATNN